MNYLPLLLCLMSACAEVIPSRDPVAEPLAAEALPEVNLSAEDVGVSQPPRMYGVTTDSIDHLPQIVDSLKSFKRRMTTRIVFDEGMPASYYKDAATQIHGVSDVMGEILDSFVVKKYSVEKYQARVKEYLDTLGSSVDIWEVGNEVNGEWLGKTSDVVAKVSGAYDQVKARGLKTELTLYFNQDCWANRANEMFTWAAANVPARMKQGLDYVLVSYYEDDCNGYQPDWQTVFNRLGALFPNAKIGIGESGSKYPKRKVATLRRYYQMNVVHPQFIGGNFWWYFKQDMVPKSRLVNGVNLWGTLNNLL